MYVYINSIYIYNNLKDNTFYMNKIIISTFILNRVFGRSLVNRLINQ